ncbi:MULTISPECIES: hypothetical protein [Halorussus]|uniref:hypothetical protein n=1 Tax=Halorussus TaxID=1070314 RepID=UPI000E21105C|nr:MULTISPECIES: hypothetical protein [Halorussus]NHN60069.1 hypothetical protein [Halorussus sp. JP-T4]
MTTPHALRDLATLIETIDDADISIDGVRTPEGSLVDGPTLTAELTVRLDWGALDDVGSPVSVALPDDGEVESDESGVAFPLDVELDVGDGETETEPVAGTGKTAETAKTQVTDGGVAMVRSDDPADADADRDAETDAPEADEETGATEAKEETGTTEREEQIDAAESTETSDEADTDDGAEADATPEPHRDPERLREAYESCDTFPEMAEALGASVTPQTVRYHAIELGIHRPHERPSSAGRAEVESAGDESSSADHSDERHAESERESVDSGSEAESTVSATDDQPSTPGTENSAAATETADDEGESRPPEPRTEDLPADVDLPSHVTLADLRDAVSDATTLYEVQRDLRVDRSAARRLLRDLNLLDLVTGRAATADERSTSAASIDERIRRACA